MVFDLIYPETTAGTIGEDAGAGTAEMLPVIDENGFVLSQAARPVCHMHGYLHPVVHLHIIDRMSNLYLQHRSPDKDLMPDRWDTAVGGHVSYGEFIEEALYREAGEELGFYEFNPQLIHRYVFENGGDHELVCVYATVGHFDIHPDNCEVREGRYWTFDEIEAARGKSILTPQFESEFEIVRDKLLALL
ncbi:MAG: NUDIX domain-containing protein [Bacteroidales bacterium]|nr:NUDIX domain-containing protein [Bacteroidales bacterium]